MNEAMIGGPILTNWLAIVGVISILYWGFRIVSALQHRGGKAEASAPSFVAATLPAATAPPASASGPPPEDIVAIAAAVHAMLGAHRIVRLEATQTGQTWAAEGRWMHQTSHRPG
jgi:hypothetical protein